MILFEMNMKHKTHKGLAKRIKLSGSKKNKKLIHGKQYDNHHLKTNKTAMKKNRMSGDKTLAKTDKTKVILKWI